MTQDTQDTEEIRDESDPEPQLFAVSQSAAGYHFTRRDFLEAAAATAALAALTSCTGIGGGGGVEVETPDTPFTNTPPPTATTQPTDTPAPTDTATPQPTNTPRPSRTPRPTDTATPTDTPVLDAQAMARATLNVRGGPGTAYPIIGSMSGGEARPLIGQLAGGEWLQVEFPPTVGWVSASLVDINVDLVGIPVITDLPTPPPAPAATSPSGGGETGEMGIEFTVEGKTYTMPCGSPLPAGAVCICNCVAAPPGGGFTCTCNSICTCDAVCSCDTVCSCVGETHYWYPN